MCGLWGRELPRRKEGRLRDFEKWVVRLRFGVPCWLKEGLWWMR